MLSLNHSGNAFLVQTTVEKTGQLVLTHETSDCFAQTVDRQQLINTSGVTLES